MRSEHRELKEREQDEGRGKKNIGNETEGK